MVNPNGVCDDPELRTGAGAERRGNPPVVKLRRPPTRGQAQQRQSRFRLFPRNNVDVATAFDQKKGKLVEHRSDGVVALAACSRTSSATTVSFPLAPT